MKEKNGLLTQQMDIGTDGFNEFQAILLNKSREKSSQQKLNIELLALKFKMEDYIENETNETKLAGDFLKQYLQSLRIQQNKFAEYIGLKPSNLSKLISGERPINYNLALIFGKMFHLDPMLWIKIQAKNELNKIKNKKENDFLNYSLNDLIHESNNVV